MGPYVDTELGVPVMTALSAYYEGDTPTMLVTMSIPVDALVEHLDVPATVRASRYSTSGVCISPGTTVLQRIPFLT